jgi:hypothetical protein
MVTKGKVIFVDTNGFAEFKYNDGGRAAAGYKGETGDCGIRATAIATGMDYKKVYAELFQIIKKDNVLNLNKKSRKKMSPQRGIYRETIHKYLSELGWEWKPTMFIGSGCKVHLKANELPTGRIILRLSGHYSCIINGIINDTSDCSREGTRCVYGYWKKNIKI